MSAIAELVARGRAAAAAMTREHADASAALLIDTVGCSVSGLGHPYVAGLREIDDGSSRARILAEAMLAHVDEFDPIHPASAVLPCASVVGPALAVARQRDCSGIELLRAVVAGAEVAVGAGLRFGGAALYERRWWPTALFGALGAAMACALLLDLDEQTTCAAVAISANGLGGLLSADQLGAGHYLLVGRAAADGYQAALAAGAGWTSSMNLLDVPATAALGPAIDPDAQPMPHLLAAAIKPFPCARPLHAVAAALQHNGTGLDIGADPPVRIGLPSAALRFVTADRRPTGPAETAASAIAVLAAVAAGRVDDPSFYRESPDLTGVDDVDLYAATDLDAAFPARWGAIVETRSGQRIVAPDAPDTSWLIANRAARRERFRRLTARQWGAEDALRWFDDASRLPYLDTVGPVLDRRLVFK